MCEKKEAAVRVTKRFSLYVILLVAALIFTQALANVASYICFLFLLFVPLVLFLYVLTAKSALTVRYDFGFLYSGKRTAEYV